MKRQTLHIVTACLLVFGVMAAIVSGVDRVAPGPRTSPVAASYADFCRAEIDAVKQARTERWSSARRMWRGWAQVRRAWRDLGGARHRSARRHAVHQLRRVRRHQRYLVLRRNRARRALVDAKQSRRDCRDRWAQEQEAQPSTQPQPSTEPSTQTQPSTSTQPAGALQPLCDAGLAQAVCDATDQLPQPRADAHSPLRPLCADVPRLQPLCAATTGVPEAPDSAGDSGMQPLCDAGLPQEYCDLAVAILPGLGGLPPLPGVSGLDLPDLDELVELLGAPRLPDGFER